MTDTACHGFASTTQVGLTQWQGAGKPIMGRVPKAGAAIRAAIATGIGAILMLVPPIGIPIFLLVFMLPLWALDNADVINLGDERHGFFVPNIAGWCLMAAVTWTVFFAIFYRRAKQKIAPPV